MALTFLIIINILMFLFTLTVCIFLLINYLRNKKENVRKNGTILFNFAPEITNGHSVFQEISCKPHADGRTVSKLIPKDVDDYSEEIPKLQILPCSPGHRIMLPAGSHSSYRNVVLAFSAPENLPKELLQSQFGKGIFNTIQINDLLEEANKRFAQNKEFLSRVGLAGEETLSLKILENEEAVIERMKDMLDKDKRPKGLGLGGDFPPMQ